MDALSEEQDSIKSVTLADLEFGKPSPYDRLMSLGKMALMLWGGLSFGAAAGTAAYYFTGPSDTPLLVGEARTAAPLPAAKPAGHPVTLALAETAPAPAANGGAADGPQSTASIAPGPAPDARLPRPRPDEPIYTGSADPPMRVRRGDPCTVLGDFGVRFLFGARCVREVRVYAPPPPPPRYYYPEPYDPPYVVR